MAEAPSLSPSARPAEPVSAGSEPYVGPRPVGHGEVLYGRDPEVAALVDLVIAKRIVLLYSPSGAGKTSLLNAGLIPALQAEGFCVLPVIRVNQGFPPPGPQAAGAAAVDRYTLSALQSLEAVINLPSPEGESGASASVAPVDITQDPSYVVVTIDEDDTVWVEDEEVFGEQNLRSKLRTVRSEGDERDGLLVIGDPDATHGQLVTVLDAGADAGFKELMFSVGEQPEG